ncbi:hypothetical protein ACES2L_14950 [Bdellovibrio bacteriovorus]
MRKNEITFIKTDINRRGVIPAMHSQTVFIAMVAFLLVLAIT